MTWLIFIPKLYSQDSDKLSDLVRNQHALAPKQVYEEIISPKSLHEWCKANKPMFLPINQNVWDKACEITEKFPKLVNSRMPGQQADPFIIALAATLKHSLAKDEPIIITHESSRRLNNIPSVARKFGIESERMTGLFSGEGWRF